MESQIEYVLPMTRARVLMTIISLKYAFKKVKICNYMPLDTYLFNNNCCVHNIFHMFSMLSIRIALY